MEQYPTVIAKPNEPPGRTNVIQHEIHLTDTRPIAQRPYKIRDPVKVDFLRNELAKWKRDGIIQETKSPWASPLVLVEKTKKETAGELRICADFRGINKITKRDRYPLPRIQDILDNFKGATYFTTLDLASGFHQVEIKPEH